MFVISSILFLFWGKSRFLLIGIQDLLFLVSCIIGFRTHNKMILILLILLLDLLLGKNFLSLDPLWVSSFLCVVLIAVFHLLETMTLHRSIVISFLRLAVLAFSDFWEF